jgi:hypothetical protein
MNLPDIKHIQSFFGIIFSWKYIRPEEKINVRPHKGRNEGAHTAKLPGRMGNARFPLVVPVSLTLQGSFLSFFKQPAK